MKSCGLSVSVKVGLHKVRAGPALAGTSAEAVDVEVPVPPVGRSNFLFRSSTDSVSDEDLAPKLSSTAAGILVWSHGAAALPKKQTHELGHHRMGPSNSAPAAKSDEISLMFPAQKVQVLSAGATEQWNPRCKMEPRFQRQSLKPSKGGKGKGRGKGRRPGFGQPQRQRCRGALCRVP